MTLTAEAEAILKRVKIVAPEGVSEEVAKEKVQRAVLRRLIAQALDAGVQLTYADWLKLPEYERACWEAIALEKQQNYWAMMAAACGNTAMARKALHIDNPDAQVDDAIEQGLRKVGLA